MKKYGFLIICVFAFLSGVLICLPFLNGELKNEHKQNFLEIDSELSELEEEYSNLFSEMELKYSSALDAFTAFIEEKNARAQLVGSTLTIEELVNFGEKREYNGYLFPSFPASMGIEEPCIDWDAVFSYEPIDDRLISQLTPEERDNLFDTYLKRIHKLDSGNGDFIEIEEIIVDSGEFETAQKYGVDLFETWTVGQLKSYCRYVYHCSFTGFRLFTDRGIFPKDFSLASTAPYKIHLKDFLSYKGLSSYLSGRYYTSNYGQIRHLEDEYPELQKVFKIE